MGMVKMNGVWQAEEIARRYALTGSQGQDRYEEVSSGLKLTYDIALHPVMKGDGTVVGVAIAHPESGVYSRHDLHGTKEIVARLIKYIRTMEAEEQAKHLGKTVANKQRPALIR